MPTTTKTRRRKPAAPVVTKRLGIDHLDPTLRAEVMRLAGEDVKRIEVISRTEAIVR